MSIRKFFQRTAGVAVTKVTRDASIIQTRHRIPETALHEGQILVYQVPIPEPLRFLEPREVETRKMHELEEYGLMHVKLYEDIARHGTIATAYAYPVKVEGRYVMDPSPIPKFDNPKLSNSPALQLFGAGREQRIYALPPFTHVVSLDFDDHPFVASKAPHDCDLCGSSASYLDEVITDDQGGRMFVCSDTDFCRTRRAAGHTGRLTALTGAVLTGAGLTGAAPPPHPSPTGGEGAVQATNAARHDPNGTPPPPRGEGMGVGGHSPSIHPAPQSPQKALP